MLAPLDPTPRTLLLVAFQPEWAALVSHVEDAVAHKVNGRIVLTGSLSGQPVLLAETGVSMVNAAMVTQALIDRAAVTRIVVSGIAGGIDPALNVGDVVVPARWGQFLEVGFGRPGAAGPALPPLPGETDRPPHGVMIPRDVLVGNADEPVAARRWFVADAGSLAIARRLAASEAFGVVVDGTGISGSAFVDNADYRRYLHATFDAQVVDMETAAIAQVAFANLVPFIAFRALSDLAGGEADANSIPQQMAAASAHAARVVRDFVAALPDR